MPRALGPRFALEAGFLILLAVVLGFAELSPLLIIVIMALAWVLVSLIEYFAWRQGPSFPTRYAAATGPAVEQEHVMVEERPVEEAPPPPPPAPARAPEPEPAPPPVDEQTMVEERPEPEPEREAAETLPAEEQDRDATFAAERRARYRLEPLQPRPRRRFGLFGPRVRPDESSSEKER